MLTEITYNRLKIMINRKGIDMYMYYCRNVFDICLRNKGIESEIIGLLDEELVPTPCVLLPSRNQWNNHNENKTSAWKSSNKTC